MSIIRGPISAVRSLTTHTHAPTRCGNYPGPPRTWTSWSGLMSLHHTAPHHTRHTDSVLSATCHAARTPSSLSHHASSGHTRQCSV